MFYQIFYQYLVKHLEPLALLFFQILESVYSFSCSTICHWQGPSFCSPKWKELSDKDEKKTSNTEYRQLYTSCRCMHWSKRPTRRCKNEKVDQERRNKDHTWLEMDCSWWHVPSWFQRNLSDVRESNPSVHQSWLYKRNCSGSARINHSSILRNLILITLRS